MADIGDTVAPKADQMVNEDLMNGPRTFTVSRVVVKPNAEQPVDVYLEEFGPLPYRPSKGMRDVMIAGWGQKSATYAGKRLTLYRDAGVKFGTTVWGGIRISHMSDLPNDKPLPVQLRISRGKKGPHVVKPLVDSNPVQPPAPVIELGPMFDALKATGISEAEYPAYVIGVIGRSITGWADLSQGDVESVTAEALNTTNEEK